MRVGLDGAVSGEMFAETSRLARNYDTIRNRIPRPRQNPYGTLNAGSTGTR
jgi:hypothetical protein